MMMTTVLDEVHMMQMMMMMMKMAIMMVKLRVHRCATSKALINLFILCPLGFCSASTVSTSLLFLPTWVLFCPYCQVCAEYYMHVLLTMYMQCDLSSMHCGVIHSIL